MKYLLLGLCLSLAFTVNISAENKKPTLLVVSANRSEQDPAKNNSDLIVINRKQ